MESLQKMPKWVLVLLCCLLVSSLCAISIWMFRMGAQQALNNEVRAETISGATPRKLWLCPNDPTWEKIKFTNGTYCIQPGSIGKTDSKGNLIGVVKTPCPGNMQTINGNQYCVTSQ